MIMVFKHGLLECCDKTVRDNFKILFGYWGTTISADSWTKEMLKSHKRSPHGPLAPKKLHFPKIGLFIPELKIIKIYDVGV